MTNPTYFQRQQLILCDAPLRLDPTILRQFEQRLRLSFIQQEYVGQVCFANQNKDLQDAYKQVFYLSDLLAYIQACSTSDTDLIPYPTDPLQFWHIVKSSNKPSH